jgi:superfamily I DNA/RNA helicase
VPEIVHEMRLAGPAGGDGDGGTVADRLAAAVRRLSGRGAADRAAAVDVMAAGEVLVPLARRCGADLDRFLTEIALGAEADALDPRADAITLLTLHAAKGLEFGAVFLAGCERGLLPLWLPGSGTRGTAARRADGGTELQAAARGADGGTELQAAARGADGGTELQAAARGADGGTELQAAARGADGGTELQAAARGADGGTELQATVPGADGGNMARRPEPDLAEERRLLFVGMTRARAHLFLTSAAQRHRHGTVTATGPSPFLAAISPTLFSRTSGARPARPADRQLRLL